MPKNDDPNAVRFSESMKKHGEQEKGDSFAEKHPLSGSAGIKKRHEWAAELCAFLNDNYDDGTVKAIRMDCACMPEKEFCSKLRAVYEKDSDPYVFVENINALDLGLSMEYDGTSYYIIYPQCYCPCVNRINEPLPEAWCYCTLGYTKKMFEIIFGKEVVVGLISSVKQGDAVCRIRITG